MRAILNESKRLAATSTWFDNKAEVQFIQREFNGRNTFTTNTLSKIRNKIVFHYDLAPMTEIASIFLFDEISDLAQAQSEVRKDLAFTLSESIILDYVLRHTPSDGTDSEKWAYFREKLFQLSDCVTKLAESFTYDLLEKNIELVEES